MTLDDITITTDGLKITEDSIGGWLTPNEKELVRQVSEDTGEKYIDLCKQLYLKKVALARKERTENE